MKYRPSFAFDELSGKAGSVVAVNNRKNPFLRPRITPINPNSSAQQGVRADLTSLAQGWGALTDSQRQAWNNAVADYQTTGLFGNKRNPTGFNLYMKLNGNLLDCNATTISTPALKVSMFVPELVSVAGDVSDGSVDVTFTEVAVPAGFRYVIRAAALNPVGRKIVKGDFRNIAVVNAAADPTADYGSVYEAKFGSLVAGKRIAVEVVAVSTVTGQKSQPISIEAIVQA